MKQVSPLPHYRTWVTFCANHCAHAAAAGRKPTARCRPDAAANPDSPTVTLTWNTFLGGGNDDRANTMVVDGAGNIYLTGTSRATWGTPVNPIQGDDDAFVAKLNSNGTLQWLTFLGSSSTDGGYGLTVDGSGNVYVVGHSWVSWGSPVRPHGGNGFPPFVAKLNSNGALAMAHLLGGAGFDDGWAIARNASGEIYVGGTSKTAWGTPLRPFSSGEDAFVAKLNSSGALQILTFLGGAGEDKLKGLVVDTNVVYVIGESGASWGDPERPYSGGADAYVARLNGSLTLPLAHLLRFSRHRPWQWHCTGWQLRRVCDRHQ